jgi:hypothetical protein
MKNTPRTLGVMGFVEQLIIEGRTISIDCSLYELRNRYPKQLGPRWLFNCSPTLAY